jgi:hypothetical protein
MKTSSLVVEQLDDLKQFIIRSVAAFDEREQEARVGEFCLQIKQIIRQSTARAQGNA